MILKFDEFSYLLGRSFELSFSILLGYLSTLVFFILKVIFWGKTINYIPMSDISFLNLFTYFLFLFFLFPQSSSIQMDDWVLCRVFLKRRTQADHDATESCKKKKKTVSSKVGED